MARLRPHAVSIYVGLILGFAIVATLGAALLSDLVVADGRLLPLVLFAVCAFIGELRPQHWMSKQDGGEVTATWTFGFAMLFLAPPPIPIVLMAIAIACAEIVLHKDLLRVLFNASQIALSMAVASMIFDALADRSVLAVGTSVNARWLLAAIVATTIATVMNNLLTCGVVALFHRVPLRSVVRGSFGANLTMDGLLIALGPVFAVVAVTANVLLPLLLVAVWVVHLSGSLALQSRHEASHDQLTGLPNRRHFNSQAQTSLEAASEANRLVGFIHLDLNGFKEINDRLGHHYGDLVLQEVAARLLSAKRPGDLVARLGGDEFAVLMREVDDVDCARASAERFFAQMARPMEVNGLPLAVSGSFGVAVFPHHGEGLEALLHNADMAMYEAKTARSGVEIYKVGLIEVGPNRIGLAADLSAAIERDELFLEYQPRVSLATGKLCGVEALVRWQHPEHGVILPDRFIPLAEQSELIKPLTDRVATLAIQQCAQWARHGLNIRVAINASARNLHDLDFPTMLVGLLAAEKVDGRWLELEITENTVMTDSGRSGLAIRQLRRHGVAVSIDDFGTGFSSLATLRDLTPDWLKIDRSFVGEICDRPASLAIVESVVKLAHALGVRAVAEGVESHEQLEVLASIGCDSVQGYYIARPMTPAQVASWVQLEPRPSPAAIGAAS